MLRTSSLFGVYLGLFVILMGSLIYFADGIHGLSLSTTVLGQEISTTNHNSTILINQGKYLNNIGNYTEAIEYFDKVLSSEPSNTEALHGKGLTIDNLGNHTEAIKYFDQSLENDPENTDVLYGKRVILNELGNHTEAMKYFKNQHQ